MSAFVTKGRFIDHNICKRFFTANANAGKWKVLKAIIGGLVGTMLFGNVAMATTCGSYTYTLSNGTTADANQVNSNFSTILNCANTLLAPLASPNFTGNAYFSGNIGIGTASPSQALDVIANPAGTSIQIRLASTNTDATAKNARLVAGTYTNSNNPLLLIGSQTTGTVNPIYIGGIQGATAITAATSINFATAAALNTNGGTTRMTIDSLRQRRHWDDVTELYAPCKRFGCRNQRLQQSF